MRKYIVPVLLDWLLMSPAIGLMLWGAYHSNLKGDAIWFSIIGVWILAISNRPRLK